MTSDLHLHSLVSDGTLDPPAVLQHAARVGIAQLAIADHDSLGAYEWEGGCVFDEARRLGQQLLVGIELDADLGGVEVHLLGYDVELGASALSRHVVGVQELRFERARREIAIVNDLLGRDAVRESDVFRPGRRTLMKPHFIHPLLDKGFFPTYKAANAWYKQNVKSGIDVVKPALREAIELVHSAGGWAVLAHPGYYVEDGIDARDRLGELRESGLDGVEVEYPYHSCSPDAFSAEAERAIVDGLREVAGRLGLRMTRGSDCHTPADFARVYGAGAAQ
jgi:predicted metal-dependent phosphoesterase TrpH